MSRYHCQRKKHKVVLFVLNMYGVDPLGMADYYFYFDIFDELQVEKHHRMQLIFVGKQYLVYLRKHARNFKTSL